MKPELHMEVTKSGILLDRELSQLTFNRRVMAQAEDPNIPLLERLRYLCIVSSNMDEFFEVRVASLLAAGSIGRYAGRPPCPGGQPGAHRQGMPCAGGAPVRDIK